MFNNFLLATVTEVEESTNHVKVKFVEYDNIICKDFIPVMMPPMGVGQEGSSAPLGEDDLVVVAFFDMQRQNPFVMGKIYSSTEFVANKKIVFFEHEIEFTEDKITIDHKDKNSTITIEADTITIEGSSTIKLGKSAAESIIKGDTFASLFDLHKHIGNLGYNSGPPLPPNNFLSTPAAKSTKVKTE